MQLTLIKSRHQAETGQTKANLDTVRHEVQVGRRKREKEDWHTEDKDTPMPSVGFTATVTLRHGALMSICHCLIKTHTGQTKHTRQGREMRSVLPRLRSRSPELRENLLKNLGEQLLNPYNSRFTYIQLARFKYPHRFESKGWRLQKFHCW